MNDPLNPQYNRQFQSGDMGFDRLGEYRVNNENPSSPNPFDQQNPYGTINNPAFEPNPLLNQTTIPANSQNFNYQPTSDNFHLTENTNFSGNQNFEYLPQSQLQTVPAHNDLPQESPSNSSTSNKKLPKNSFKNLVRFSTVLILLILIGVTGLLVYAVTNPEDKRFDSLFRNTPLENLVTRDTDEDQIQDQTSTIKEDPKDVDPGLAEFTSEREAKSIVEVVEEVLPSVLSISLKTRADSLNIAQDLTAGTGFIVTPEGLVVTNKHVVSVVCKNDPANILISALSHDQQAYELELLTIDPIDDVALLKVVNGRDNFKPLSLADSNQLKLAQEVVAIGNVLGELQNTVTKGIVSGLNRSFETELNDPCTNTNFQADNLIQTDAAINKGNSGGPLFNAAGELIGMNTLGTVDAQNIGLAIPTSTLKTILESFKNNNQIVRARLGVTSLQINPLRKAQNSWIPRDYGEIVFSQEGNPVAANSAAAEVGIGEGDIILEIDGNRLVATNTNPSPLRREILSKQPGSSIKLKVLKSNSKNNQGYGYESEPIVLDVILGSVSFNISNREVVVN